MDMTLNNDYEEPNLEKLRKSIIQINILVLNLLLMSVFLFLRDERVGETYFHNPAHATIRPPEMVWALQS